MGIRRSIRQIDRFEAADARGRHFGIDVFAEVVEHRFLWRVRHEVGDVTFHLANGVVLQQQEDGRLTNVTQGYDLRPLANPAGLLPPAMAHARPAAVQGLFGQATALAG